MSVEEYASLPGELKLRLIKSVIQQPGFRAKTIEVLSSLTDSKYRAEEIASLYADRWLVEVDLRSIKSEMQMGELRCKTPSMVRKEIWVHLLAYNLIPTLMMAAAIFHRRAVRSFGFKATMQLLCVTRDRIFNATRKQQEQWLLTLFKSLKNQTVGNRPGRYEPRAVKKQPKANVAVLNVPRAEARKKHWKHCA